eukprot:gene51133-59379_t
MRAAAHAIAAPAMLPDVVLVAAHPLPPPPHMHRDGAAPAAGDGCS